MTNPSEATGPRKILRSIEQKSRAAAAAETADEIFATQVMARKQDNMANMSRTCGFSPLHTLSANEAMNRFFEYHATALAVEQILRERLLVRCNALGESLDALRTELFGQPTIPTHEEKEALAVEHAPIIADATTQPYPDLDQVAIDAAAATGIQPV